MKHFNNNTGDDNTYDGKIRGKISDIRMIFSRLGNTGTNKDKKKTASWNRKKEKSFR